MERETEGGPADVTSEERATLGTLKAIENYPFIYLRDLAHIRTLAVDHPTVDLLEEAKRWRTYKLDNPLESQSNPRSQFRTWVRKSIEFGRAKVRKGVNPGYDPAIHGELGSGAQPTRHSPE
jgi:hypothetical protein